MNILPSRGNVSLFDELFRDFTPAFSSSRCMATRCPAKSR